MTQLRLLRCATVALASALLATASCSTTAGPTPGPTLDPHSSNSVTSAVPGGMPRPAHILVAIFENKSASQVVGSGRAPYLTGLADRGAYFVRAHGVAHPSEPNYLALFSGSTHGVTSDACPVHLGRNPNLASQLAAAGDSFVGYAEGLPSPGYNGCGSGGYARKHAPWTNFTNLPARTAQPFSAFPRNFAALPTVSFVVPNLCDDMHDCSVRTGDRWAQHHLNPYVTWAMTHNSLLIVTFDEDDGTEANHIPTLLAGPMVRRGRFRQVIDHYSVLRTIEDMYRLRPLGSARRASPLRCWRR
jgi:acid phosphatase